MEDMENTDMVSFLYVYFSNNFPKIFHAFEKSLQERSTVMEVRRVNIAIVITANASTVMVPPDTGIAIEKRISPFENSEENENPFCCAIKSFLLGNKHSPSSINQTW